MYFWDSISLHLSKFKLEGIDKSLLMSLRRLLIFLHLAVCGIYLTLNLQHLRTFKTKFRLKVQNLIGGLQLQLIVSSLNLQVLRNPKHELALLNCRALIYKSKF